MTDAIYTLRCASCGRGYAAGEAPDYVCAACAQQQTPGAPLRGLLEVVYDYAAWRAQHRAGDALSQPLLPCTPDELARIPLRIGATPLYRAPRLAARAQVAAVWLKDDTSEPTGSYKDRATQLVVAMALRRGAAHLTCASTGNAACSLAGVCAAAGLHAHIFVSARAPRAKLAQIAAYGADVIAVDGTYDDCFDMSLAATREHGWYNRNTAYNPWTIEGKKTAAWEIGVQCAAALPDQVFVPTGDGTMISGIYKGFHDLHALGWITRIPRLVAVQPHGSAAIAAALAEGADGYAAHHAGAASVADSLVVRAPRCAALALRALRASNGYAVRVTDEEILHALVELAAQCGVFAEPAAAAAWAGLLAARHRGLIRPDETAAVLITGTGLKDVAAAERALALCSGRHSASTHP